MSHDRQSGNQAIRQLGKSRDLAAAGVKSSVLSPIKATLALISITYEGSPESSTVSSLSEISLLSSP